MRFSCFSLGLATILALALALRLHGIHDPILDHPAWRQGDTASIARNFARLQYNIVAPQTNYDGPPPNYVELELQIVPFIAATLYKTFGVHEIFGRLITLAFSLGTVAVLGLFGRWLFGTWIAGLGAAFVYAVMPGSIYYGRTFTPDATMVFFLTAALYAAARFLTEDEKMAPRALARVTALLTFAYLAKPVAVAGVVPLLALMWERLRSGRAVRVSALAVMLVIPLVILWLYDGRVAERAEWHWASGITQRHVLPALRDALTSPAGFVLKWQQFCAVMAMFRETVAGTVWLLLAIAGAAACLRAVPVRTPTLIAAWLVSGLAYTYVVVTVERVDYYMLLLLPPLALLGGAAITYAASAIASATMSQAARWGAAVAALAVIVFGVAQSRAAIAPYYRYNKAVYRQAIALDRLLDRNALVVVAHYGPDVLYYVNRYGWEEDPANWTPFDEESAIKKGARYFISIEDRRFRRNDDLCAWMQRFPIVDTRGTWPVYQTDPALVKPGADAFWRSYRAAELARRGRDFLTAHGLCLLDNAQ